MKKKITEKFAYEWAKKRCKSWMGKKTFSKKSLRSICKKFLKKRQVQRKLLASIF